MELYLGIAEVSKDRHTLRISLAHGQSHGVRAHAVEGRNGELVDARIYRNAT